MSSQAVATGGAGEADELPAEERLLRATMAGLAQLDPAAVTIKRLCGAAGVTPPTLYYHFGNKDGLLAAAVERLVEAWLLNIDAAVTREAALEVTIAEAVAAWTEAITSPDRPVAVFTWATLLLGDSSEQARAALVRGRDRGREMIEQVVALHAGPGTLAHAVAGLVVDSVIASAVQYELDHDPLALGTRFEALGAVLRVTLGAPGLQGLARDQ